MDEARDCIHVQKVGVCGGAKPSPPPPPPSPDLPHVVQYEVEGLRYVSDVQVGARVQSVAMHRQLSACNGGGGRGKGV